MFHSPDPLLVGDWNLVLYTTLLGLSVGLMAAATWLDRRAPGAPAARWAAYLTWAVTGAGLLFLLFHLGQPARFFFVFRNWHSPLTWEAVLALGFFVAAVAYALGWRLQAAGGTRRIIGLVATAFGAADLAVMGWQHMLVARPLWNTPVLPLLYLGWAAATGFVTLYALHVLLPGDRQGAAASPGLLRTSLGAVLAAAVIGVVYLAFVSGASPEAAAGFLTGAEAPLFWVHAGLLVVIPLGLGLTALGARGGTARWTAPVMALSALCGTLAARVLLFNIGSLTNYLP